MPEKRRKQEDANEIARRVLLEATRKHEIEPEPPTVEKNPAAVELGRRGGLKGGHARAANLSPERRKEIAEQAAAARWKKR